MKSSTFILISIIVYTIVTLCWLEHEITLVEPGLGVNKSFYSTHHNLQSHTVLISGTGYHPTRRQGVSWFGTGVVIKNTEKYTFILTNEHVARNSVIISNQKLFIINGLETYWAEIVKIHPSQDLAVIKTPRLYGKEAIRGVKYPEVDMDVYNVGNGPGRYYMYARGVFSGTTFWHDVFQLPTVTGFSGSGVFDSDGYLVGLLYSISNINGIRDITRGNSVKAIYIKDFIAEYL